MELGQRYMLEFSGDDIQSEILAEELGMSEFRFPDEQYKHAGVVVQQIVEKFIPHLRGLSLEEVGDYLLEHRDELFGIFDAFPTMYRLPLLVTKENLIAHGTLSAGLLEMESREFYGHFLNCMHFYLYLKSIQNLSKLYQKYPQVQPFPPRIDQIVQDECRNELACGW